MGSTFTMLAAGLLVAQSAAAPAAPAPGADGKPCPCQKNAAAQGYVQPVAVAPAASTGMSPTTSPGLFRGLFSKSEPDAVVVQEERPSLFSRLFKKSEPATPAPVYSNEPPIESAKPGPFRMMQRLPAGQPSNEPGALTIPTNVPQAATTQVPPAPVKVNPVTYQAVPPGQPAPAPLAIPQTIPQNIPAAPAPMVKPVSGTVSGNNVIKTTELPPSRPNRLSQDLVNKVGHEADYSWITGQLRIENGLYVIHYAPPEVVDQYQGSLVLTSERDLRGFQDGDFVSVRGQVTGGVNGRMMYRVQSIDRLQR